MDEKDSQKIFVYSTFCFLFLFASEMEGGNDNNDNNQNYNYNGNNNNGVDPYQTYYMGAYCSARDGQSIYLGVFLDSGCSTRAGNDKDVYAAKMYGAELPYADTPIVSSECISCVSNDNDNNNNNSEYRRSFSQHINICFDVPSHHTLFQFLSTMKTLKTTRQQ
jgi:hypothetical protein